MKTIKISCSSCNMRPEDFIEFTKDGGTTGIVRIAVIQNNKESVVRITIAQLIKVIEELNTKQEV